MTKRTITNPVTGKMQRIGQDKPNVKLLKLGFDNTGKVVYQETEEKGALTFRGYLPDAVHFLGFN